MIEQKQAIKDMIDFIAEFGLWLEGEVAQSKRNIMEFTPDETGSEIIGRDFVLRMFTLEKVLENYLRCKERIEYDSDPQVLRLTHQEAEVLEYISEVNIEDDDKYAKHKYETIQRLEKQGYIKRRALQPQMEVFVLTDTGRAALKKYQDSHNDE